MQRKVVSAAAAVIVSMGLIAGAGAETKPENAIKYRKAVMESMAGHVSAIMLIAFNQVPDEGFLEGHTEALADLGGELRIVFPEGSGAGETEALPAIWEQPEKFSTALDDAAMATDALNEAVKSGDRKAIAGAFKQVGESCKGCHESFREEHEN